jgi:ribosomal protein S24E
LADALKVDPETIQLRPLKQKTGRNEANGIALIYKSPERARLIEQKYLADRLKPKEKKEEEKVPKTEEKPKPAVAPKKEEKKEKKEEKKDVK